MALLKELVLTPRRKDFWACFDRLNLYIFYQLPERGCFLHVQTSSAEQLC